MYEIPQDSDSTVSHVTLNKTFFDDLWPMILQWNRCDTHSKNTSPYFVPKRRFDSLWAHTLLASRGYKNYHKPIDLHCYQAAESELEQVSVLYSRSDEYPSLSPSPAQIVPLDKQIEQLQQEHHQRQKLAYDFVNRNFPWYTKRPIYEAEFEINDEVRDLFVKPFELEILRNIHAFQCKLMLIDVGSDVGMRDMERWLKYCRYVQMIAMVRCPIMARQLLLLGGAFYSLFVVENLENTWQEELVYSLDAGVQYAKELKLFENCAKSFVFVFSKERGMCTCDTFKILRKA